MFYSSGQKKNKNIGSLGHLRHDEGFFEELVHGGAILDLFHGHVTVLVEPSVDRFTNISNFMKKPLSDL